MTLTEMPRRIRHMQQNRAPEALTSAELAQTFYDLAQFHAANGRHVDAVANYATALQMDLAPALRPYCRAYLADNLCKTQRFEEARRRASGLLAETTDPELTHFLTRLLETIERALATR